MDSVLVVCRDSRHLICRVSYIVKLAIHTSRVTDHMLYIVCIVSDTSHVQNVIHGTLQCACSTTSHSISHYIQSFHRMNRNHYMLESSNGLSIRFVIRPTTKCSLVGSWFTSLIIATELNRSSLGCWLISSRL